MEATVVRREPRDGMAIIEELVQVRGVTDVEGWMLRDKVAIVVGLVRAEGGWGGVGGLTLVGQALWDGVVVIVG